MVLFQRGKKKVKQLTFYLCWTFRTESLKDKGTPS